MIYQGNEQRFFGVYKGIVTNGNDPQRRNRLQVRIPFLHGVSGNNGGMTDDSLPWALPALPLLTDDPLPNGAVVWILFEAGIPTKPVYLGYLLKRQ